MLTNNKMIPKYKKGGKSSKPKMKESWMEESKEIHFESKPKMMGGKKDLYKEGGRKARLEGRAERVMGRAQKNWAKAQDALKYDETNNPETSNAVGYANRKLNQAARQEDRAKRIMAKANELKKGGTKSMEPGGGGRFDKMVAGLKKKGKSEESAKAIAASAGRKKYGKSRFQEMAAAGKRKKEEGGFEDEEMEMEMETTMASDKGERQRARARRRAVRERERKTKKLRRNIGKCSSGSCAESRPEV